MRYLGQQGGFERGTIVQGLGSRDDGAEFQLDGLNANAGMNEGGFAIPNVDTIAELNVETSNFSAEHGRNPLQVLVVTKGAPTASTERCGNFTVTARWMRGIPLRPLNSN